MRTTALTKEEKSELEGILKKLQLLPNVGQVLLHVCNSKVATVEGHEVWR